MAESQVKLQIKVVAEFEGRSFESVIDLENDIILDSIQSIGSEGINDALKKYILCNCDDVVILENLAQGEEEVRMLAYNPNLSPEMADALVGRLYAEGASGIYPSEFWVILKNQRVSGKMLDRIAHLLVQENSKRYKSEGTNSSEIADLLVNIACNIAVWESTLEFLKSSNIPVVVEAAMR